MGQANSKFQFKLILLIVFSIFFLRAFQSWAGITEVRRSLQSEPDNSNSFVRALEIEGTNLFLHEETDPTLFIAPIVVLQGTSLRIISLSDDSGTQIVVADLGKKYRISNTILLEVSNDQNHFRSPIFIDKGWSPIQVQQTEGTAFGNMIGDGGLQAAFDTVKFVDSNNSNNGASLIDSTTPGYIVKDWGQDSEGNDIKRIITSVGVIPRDDLYYSDAHSYRIKLFGSNTPNSWPDEGSELAVIASGNVPRGDNYIFPLTPYRYHWVMISPATPDRTSNESNRYSKYFAELEFFELTAGQEAVVIAQVNQILSGPQGEQGSAGAVGITGPQGPTGNNGTDGVVGAIGPQGPTGNNGTNGVVGATGSQGSTGNNGTDGVVGATGPQGPTGNNGTNGVVGAIGPQGPTGNNGTDGVVGATGPQGPTGNNGTNGVVGAIGPQGPTGNNGTNGVVGATGPQGPTGNNGTNGAVGATGPQGPPGDTVGSCIWASRSFTSGACRKSYGCQGTRYWTYTCQSDGSWVGNPGCVSSSGCY